MAECLKYKSTGGFYSPDVSPCMCKYSQKASAFLSVTFSLSPKYCQNHSQAPRVHLSCSLPSLLPSMNIMNMSHCHSQPSDVLLKHVTWVKAFCPGSNIYVISTKLFTFPLCWAFGTDVLDWAEKWSPGCENLSDRRKWIAKFIKPGSHFLPHPCMP